MKMRRLFALLLAAALLLSAMPVLAESVANEQLLSASYTLAMNALEAQDYETAKEYIDVCFAYCDKETNPEAYAELLATRASINVLEEKYELALLNLDAAAKVDPKRVETYIERLQIYAKQENVDKMIENLETYIELTQVSDMYESLAQLYEVKGDYADAQKAWEEYLKGAGAEVPTAEFQNGLYKYLMGDLDGAITSFETYLENEEYAANALFYIGVCKMDKFDFEGAAEAFTACEEKGGSFDGLYYNRGRCYFFTDKWVEAEADLNKAMEKESFKEESKYFVGQIRFQQEQYEEAVARFTEYINALTEAGVQMDPDAYFFRAAAEAVLGQYDKALADYDVCIAAGNRVFDCYSNKAIIYETLGDKEKQNEALEAALGLKK